MSIFDDMRSILDSGVEGSKKAIEGARERLKRLGDEGVTNLDIRQPRSEKERLLRELGRSVYHSFSVEERKTVSPKTAGINELLQEIDQIVATLAQKEAALSALKSDRAGSDTQEEPDR